jgi:hypothetical protein
MAMATDLITQDRLKYLLTYNPDTGVFTRKTKFRNLAANSVVGCVGAGGYLQCSLDSKMYKMHRLAWLYVYGRWPADQIDHINHIVTDNRINNLREVSCAENHQNRARRTKSSSGYLGVGWHKRDCCWQAHIEIGGKRHHLGYYARLPDAINARKNAEIKHHPTRPK